MTLTLIFIRKRIAAELVPSTLMVLVLIAFVMGYYQIRHVSWRLVAHSENMQLLVFAILLVCAAAGLRIRYSALPSPMASLHRCLSIAVLGYLLVDPADLTVVNVDQSALARDVMLGYWLAVLLGVWSVFRPAALLFPSFYIYLVHASSVVIVGYPSHRLASVTLAESAQFMSLCLLALGAIRYLGYSITLKKYICADRLHNRIEELAIGCMFIAISLHLSHYFWSGYEKLKIGDDLWSWIVENQTQNLVLSALYRGTLPSVDYPALTQWLYDLMSDGTVLFNAASVAVQFAAIVAVLYPRLLRLLSVVYDALHIGIYIVSGLLLWPWVANNIAIFLGLNRMGSYRLTLPIRFCCVVVIVLGGFQHFGNASRLAWWDLKDVTGSFVQAQGNDDLWVDVPLSFFNSHGRIVSLLMGQVQLHGHFSPTGWGATGEFDPARMRGDCPEPKDYNISVGESLEDNEVRQDRITKFLLAHHKKLRYREARYETSHPYPSLRYINSRHILPEGINRVADIQAYRFVLQSACLGLKEGQLLTTVIAEDLFPISLP